MAMLDTTVFVDLRGRGGKPRMKEAEEVIRRLLSAGQMLLTSRINFAELYIGVELSKDPVAERAAVDDFMKWVGILELDDVAAQSFARLRADLQRRGKLKGDMDMLIAGIALANRESVVTRNVGHFADVPGLTVVSYGH